MTGGQEIYRSLLRRYHDGPTAGHLGVWKTWQVLQQDYWWPTMKAFVKEYVAGCAVCQQNKTIAQRNQPSLQPIGPEAKPLPFATMLVDFVVKLPLSKGSDSILTITDQGCTKAVGHPSTLQRRYGRGGNRRVVQRMRLSVHRHSDKAHFGPRYMLHVVMV